MDAWIKHIGEQKNYTRFGRIIPKTETKIDMYKFFGISRQLHNCTEKVQSVANELKKDKDLFFKIHRG